jgi:CheY-like chemotaxis protein
MDQRQREILCIDDDFQSLQVRRILLETYGFNVITAVGAKEGLRAFRRHDIDLVVMDYHMPEMDGGQVARQMKRARPQMPVMILSALSWLPETAPRECIDDFVCKGQPTAALVRKIEALMAAHPQAPRRSKLLAGVAMAGKILGIAAEGVRGAFGRPRQSALRPNRPVTQMPARIHL